MSTQNQKFPDNPQIQVIKSGKTGLFTNYIFKAIPLAFDESLSYYECLCGLLDYLKNVIIPTVNNNADAVAELQTLYEELRRYVENYFDNLDVQEEINNKLDSMVEDGTLENILSKYIDEKIPKVFNTVEEMKASNLISGNKAKTLGYYKINDNGSAYYYITDEKPTTGYYETLNNGLYAILIIKDNTINVNQIGAYGDGIHDDTEKIQKAFDIFKLNTDEKQQNYSDFSNEHNGSIGAIIEFSKGIYLISKTIFVQCYHSIDLKDAVIRPLNNGTFTSNYMFSINSPDCTVWTFRYPTPENRFVKGGTIDGNNISNEICGFYCCDGRTFKDMKFIKLACSIYYPGTVNNVRMYIDMINIINITCNNSISNSRWQFEKYCDGDGFIFRDVHIWDNSNKFYNLLNLTSTRGGEISDCINGNINIVRSVVSINNWHNEFGSLTIKRAQVSVNNCYIWKYNNDVTPIKISDQNFSYTKNQDTENVIIKNTNIMYFTKLSDYNYDGFDIDLTETTFPVQLINSYRKYATDDYKEVSLSGLRIKTSNNNILNQYDNAIIENNTLYSDSKISLTNADYLSTGTLGIHNDVMWRGSQGNYYYKVIAMADTTRLLGYAYNEKNIDVTGKGVRINYDNRGFHNIILRIYRGTTSNNYTKYVDIPNPKSQHVIDNGYSVNGYQWIDIQGSNAPDVMFVDNVSYRYVSSYYSSQNCNIKIADIIGRKFNPTSGTFTKGDTIRRINAGVGDNCIAICASDDGKQWGYIKTSTE